MTRAWPRPRTSVVVVVLHHVCGTMTCHVLPHGDDLTALTRRDVDHMEIQYGNPGRVRTHDEGALAR